MRAFNRIFAAVIAVMILIFAGANLFMAFNGDPEGGRPYRVEINRLAREIEENGGEIADISDCEYVTHIEKTGDRFYASESDHAVREINGELYRFDYETRGTGGGGRITAAVNISLGVMAAAVVGVMIYVRRKILRPFEKLADLPTELAKGNLTAPIKETKNRFFGRFVWGLDMLRESIERQKRRELELQREKKTLTLSLSHDIKTPLSAIKLYAKAISKGLYGQDKQAETAEKINEKADEIESYVSQIAAASREDFLSLEVNNGEFYLSELIGGIEEYYREKLELIKTELNVGGYADCMLFGDLERAAEVLQNVMENAVKYGDGKSIEIRFSEEEGGVIVTVENSGCTLSLNELPHIFESFWRGANAGKESGSGLGLYICRRLMHKMNGEVFARINGDRISVSAVFVKV